MPLPIASVSMDLDNRWSYLKTHGDEQWKQFPSYLNLVVPRFLEFFAQRGLHITVFVVGQDAALEENGDALFSIARAGHEIGNHSFHHEPWLHLYGDEQVEMEIARAEEHIRSVTGQACHGFRGPGFSVSEAVLRTLARRGYWYDASTFPTFLGPLAKAYYLFHCRLDAEQREQRKQLFGKFSEGFRPLKPYRRNMPEGSLLEIPVTTMPVFRLPFHVSYLLYLRQFSRQLAVRYFRSALWLCRVTGTQPSLLLHPLDFLGCDDGIGLDFFPAMGMPSEEKVRFVGELIGMLAKHWRIVTMQQHALQAGVAGHVVAASADEEPGHVSPGSLCETAASLGPPTGSGWPAGLE